MINLLPPGLKEQIRYAQYNRIITGYLRLTIVVLLVIASIFMGTIFYVNHQTLQVSKAAAARQDTLVAYLPTQQKLQDASDRLSSIKTLEASQTRFSVLLANFAQYLPQGVSLEGITLTGDDKKPLSITVLGTTYDSVLAFRNAILLSPRIAGADIIGINHNSNGYEGSLVIAFKPGMAK